MRYVASLVTLYLIQLNVNGYILKGNEYVNERERDASVLDDYPIRQSAGVQVSAGVCGKALFSQGSCL